MGVRSREVAGAAGLCWILTITLHEQRCLLSLVGAHRDLVRDSGTSITLQPAGLGGCLLLCTES